MRRGPGPSAGKGSALPPKTRPGPEADAPPSPFETKVASEGAPQIEAKQAEAAAYTRKERRLVDELDDMSRLVNQTRKEVAASREKERGLAEETNKTEADLMVMAREIDALSGNAAGRLAALYKLHQLGTLPVLASADSMFELSTRKTALERVLAMDTALWEKLSAKKTRLEALHQTLARQKQAQQENNGILSGQIDALMTRSKAHAALLSDIRGKKAAMAAALDSMKKSAVSLDREVNRHDWEIHPSEATETTPGKKTFPSLKGLLQLPVTGKITGRFGTSTGSGETQTIRNGIHIQAASGEPIRAVSDGTVIFADWLKGYGNLLILDHGNGYCTVYAHGEDLFKAKGAPVMRGDVIGTVGDTGSLEGAGLYFEIRHHGKPIDPLGWLKSN